MSLHVLCVLHERVGSAAKMEFSSLPHPSLMPRLLEELLFDLLDTSLPAKHRFFLISLRLVLVRPAL